MKWAVFLISYSSVLYSTHFKKIIHVRKFVCACGEAIATEDTLPNSSQRFSHKASWLNNLEDRLEAIRIEGSGDNRDVCHWLITTDGAPDGARQWIYSMEMVVYTPETGSCPYGRKVNALNTLIWNYDPTHNQHHTQRVKTKRVPLKIRSAFTTLTQHSTGSPSHSNHTRKNKRHPGQFQPRWRRW